MHVHDVKKKKSTFLVNRTALKGKDEDGRKWKHDIARTKMKIIALLDENK